MADDCGGRPKTATPELTPGERLEIELLLERLPLDEADALAEAALLVGDEAVAEWERYVERGFGEMYAFLAINNPAECEYL